MNVNIALPHGGSGGAAINSKGELVGVCTQTKGDLTNIRSITEAKHLIEKAKKGVDQERKKKQEEQEQAVADIKSSRSCPSIPCKTHLRSVLSM